MQRKVVAILICAIVIASGLGYYSLLPREKPTIQPTPTTIQQTPTEPQPPERKPALYVNHIVSPTSLVFPAVLNVTSVIENANGRSVDSLQILQTMPEGFNLADAYLVSRDGIGLHHTPAITSEGLEYSPANPLKPNEKVTITVLLESTITSVSGNFTTIVQGTYDGKQITSQATTTIVVQPLSEGQFIQGLMQKNSTWAKDVLKRRICLEDGKLTDLEKEFLNSPSKYARQVVEVYLDQLAANASYANVAQELKKLPELRFDHAIGINDVEATEDIVNVILNADASQLGSLDRMLREGIPDKRKFCTPLQAWLWVAYDREGYNPLRNYSLDSLLDGAWLLSTRSDHFNSNLWSYEDARDRVNSPELVNWFINHYLTFDMARDRVHPQGPRTTYEVRRGVCRHASYIGWEFLTHNGYETKDVTVLKAFGQGHSVTAVRLDDGIWIVVDFRGRPLPLVGPFRTYDDVALYTAKSLGYSRIYMKNVEDNIQIMLRNQDLEIA